MPEGKALSHFIVSPAFTRLTLSSQGCVQERLTPSSRIHRSPEYAGCPQREEHETYFITGTIKVPLFLRGKIQSNQNTSQAAESGGQKLMLYGKNHYNIVK